MARVKADYTKWIAVMDEMLQDSKYDFAWERIEQLRNWVSHNKTIDGAQIKTLQDIRKKAGDL